MSVVGGDIVQDRLAQMRDGAEAAATNRLRRNLGKPAFDLIEPGAVSGNEVQVKAWVAHQPAAHGRRFVGRVVVEHQVQSQLGRGGRIDALQEIDELALGVTRLTLTG